MNPFDEQQDNPFASLPSANANSDNPFDTLPSVAPVDDPMIEGMLLDPPAGPMMEPMPEPTFMDNVWQTVDNILPGDFSSDEMSGQAKSINEWAARDIAMEEWAKGNGVSVPEVYRDAGFNRPTFNPEGRQTGQAAQEFGEVLIDQIPQIPSAIANTGLRTWRGGDFSGEPGWVDQMIDATTTDHAGDDPNYSSINNMAENLGYSAATLVPSTLATLGTGLVTKNPVLAGAAGMATSGTVAYRASKDQFITQLAQHAEASLGRPPTREEIHNLSVEFDKQATNYALWEAGPEAVGNLLFMKAFAFPLKGFTAGERALNLGQRMAGVQLSEQTTELATSLGQNDASREAGLTDEDMSTADVLNDQWLQVGLNTLLMQGGPGAVRYGYDSTQFGKERNLGNEMDAMAEEALPSQRMVERTVNPNRAIEPNFEPNYYPEETPNNLYFPDPVQEALSNPTQEEQQIGELQQPQEAQLPVDNPFADLIPAAPAQQVEEEQAEVPESPEAPEAERVDVLQNLRENLDGSPDTVAVALGVPKHKKGESKPQTRERLENVITLREQLRSQTDEQLLANKVSDLRNLVKEAGLDKGISVSRTSKENLVQHIRGALEQTQTDFDTNQQRVLTKRELSKLRQDNKPIPVDAYTEVLGGERLSEGGWAYTEGDLDVARMLGHTELKPAGQRENEAAYVRAADFVAEGALNWFTKRVELGEMSQEQFETFVLKARGIDNADQAGGILAPDFAELNLGVPATEVNVGDLYEEIIENFGRQKIERTEEETEALKAKGREDAEKEDQRVEAKLADEAEQGRKIIAAGAYQGYTNNKNKKAAIRIPVAAPSFENADLDFVKEAMRQLGISRKGTRYDKKAGEFIIPDTNVTPEQFNQLLNLAAEQETQAETPTPETKPDDPKPQQDVLLEAIQDLQRQVEELTKQSKPDSKQEPLLDATDTETEADTESDIEEDTEQEFDDGPFLDDDIKFSEVSWNTGTSAYDTLWHEIGLDPGTARNMPPAEQLKKVIAALQNKYGFKEITREKGSNARLALDSMLDAYRNLHFMAHGLGLPLTAMSLNGRLDLAIQREGKNYIGAFLPGDNIIMMPGRSNSFAHEWGHALDFHLLERITEDKFAGLSAKVRKEGLTEFDPDNTEEAFVLLMNALFFDQAKQAAELFKKERQLENAGSDARKAELQKQIDAIKGGFSKGRNSKSEYYKSSGQYRNPRYFQMPTEMLARAMEAYVAHKVNVLEGGGNEFITKGEAAYLSNADVRLAKTFPKESDRDAIFRAFDRLFEAITNETVFSGETASKPDASLGVVDPLNYMHWGGDSADVQAGRTLMKWIQDETSGVYHEMMDRRADERADRPKNPKSRWDRIADAIGPKLFAIKGMMRHIETSYIRQDNRRAAALIRQFRDLVARAPGEGRYTNDYETHVEAQINRFGLQYDKIVQRFNIDGMTRQERRNLRDVLVSQAEPMNHNISRAASELRRLMDKIWYYSRDKGVKIGYVENAGYLPRQIDRAKLIADGAKFSEQAKLVYDVVFRDDTGIDIDSETVNEFNVEKFFDEYLKHAYPNKRGNNNPAEVDMLWDLYKQYQAAEEDARDELVDAMVEVIEANWETVTETRDKTSEFSAAAWRENASLNNVFAFATSGPNADFKKERVLPKEADKLMADFYVTDPRESVMSYMVSVVKRAEFESRFGGGKLKTMMEDMLKAGVHLDDISEMVRLLEAVAGQQRHNASAASSRLFSGVHFLGTVSLLTRAVFASLAEPVTVTFHTGNPMDGARALVKTFAWATRLTGRKRREAIREVMEFTGVVQSASARTIMLSRVGGTFEGDMAFGRLLDNFFKSTLLTPLTEVQRMIAAELAIKYMGKMLRDAVKASNTKNGKYAGQELAEYKITDPSQLLDWFERNIEGNGGLPTVEALNTPLGAQFALAMQTFADYTIQNPQVSDRPYYANSPYGRLVYGILSFSYSFYNNVNVKSGKQMDRARKAGDYDKMGKYFGTFTVAMTGLILAQALSSLLRDMIFNPSKYDDDDLPEEAWAKFLITGAERSNVLGPVASVITSTLTGLRYERDLTAITAGAGPGFFFQALQTALQFMLRNSENTNTAEFRSVQGAYKLAVTPTLGWALSQLPGGRPLSVLAGAAAMYGQSNAASEQAAELIVGPKGTKTGESSTSTSRSRSRSRPSRERSR